MYLEHHLPELKSPLSASERKNLEQGKQVQEAARKAFPGGQLISFLDPDTAVEDTKHAIVSGVLTLFEGAFRYNGVLIRTDILTRNTIDSQWDLYEVKATSYNNITKEQREEYQNDIAIQVWVLKKIGFDIGRINLTHLNSECRFPDLHNLFTHEDYSKEILPILAELNKSVETLQDILIQTKKPTISIGPYCEKPHPCSFADYCWKDIPSPSVFDIPNCRKKWDFFDMGRVTIDSLQDMHFTSPVHKRVLQCYRDKQPYFDTSTVEALLKPLSYPFCYLDFESIDPPIPRYLGTHPFQHLPFQFSCHIKYQKDKELIHREFLFESLEDPRTQFIATLLEAVPREGTIIVYHDTYEKTRLKELAEAFPLCAEQLEDMKDRIFDLEEVVKKGVFLPDFLGSFSIKKVAPAILGQEASYENMEIGDGIEAQLAFEQFSSMVDSSEKAAMRRGLLEYCKQDTLLMVRLHEWLQAEVNKNTHLIGCSFFPKD